MIKAIIFDFDFTLSNRTVSFRKALLKIVNKYFDQYDEIEKEAIVQKLLFLDEFGTRKRQDSVNYLKGTYGLDEIQLQSDFDNLSMAMAPKTVLDPKAIPLLKYLKDHTKLKLAILTNGMYESQKCKIDVTGIAPYFDEVIMSAQTGYQKPDKRAFEYVADRLKLKCEECLYVGDVYFNDILGAHHAGMPFVLINNFKKWAYPETLPVIEELDDLKTYLKEITYEK